MTQSLKPLVLLTFLASSLSFAETKTIPISGMTCGACVKSVTKAVCKDLHYSAENCHVEMGKVTVTGDQIDMNAIEKAVKEAGYEVAASDANASAPAAAAATTTTTKTTTTTTKTETKKKK